MSRKLRLNRMIYPDHIYKLVCCGVVPPSSCGTVLALLGVVPPRMGLFEVLRFGCAILNVIYPLIVFLRSPTLIKDAELVLDLSDDGTKSIESLTMTNSYVRAFSCANVPPSRIVCF